MIQWLRDWHRRTLERSIFVKSEKRHYFVGDVAPDSLLNRPAGGNLGAMISVDPGTHVIKAIFIP